MNTLWDILDRGVIVRELVRSMAMDVIVVDSVDIFI